MALGLQNENAGRVSMVNYLQVALMYLSDLFIFGKELMLLDLMGTILIFSFNFINGIYKFVKRLKQLEDIKRKHLEEQNKIRNNVLENIQKIINEQKT